MLLSKIHNVASRNKGYFFLFLIIFFSQLLYVNFISSTQNSAYKISSDSCERVQIADKENIPAEKFIAKESWTRFDVRDSSNVNHLILFISEADIKNKIPFANGAGLASDLRIALSVYSKNNFARSPPCYVIDFYLFYINSYS